MKNLIFPMLAILFFSCSKEDFITQKKTNDFESYTIHKGNHYSDKSAMKLFKGNELTYAVEFDSSAVYVTDAQSNQSDINKLFGMSDDHTAHHENSARFGWRWSGNALRLFAYTYNNGVRAFQEITKVEIGEPYNCSILVRPGEYGFVVNGRETVMSRISTDTEAEGYLLWPYFGGDEVAPHDIVIRMKRLK